MALLVAAQLLQTYHRERGPTRPHCLETNAPGVLLVLGLLVFVFVCVCVCVCVYWKQVTKTRLDPSWQTVSERAQELVAGWAEASQRMVSSQALGQPSGVRGSASG